jgi:uncharacterized membrane protein
MNPVALTSVINPIFIMKEINVMVFQLKLPSSMRIHHVFRVSLLEPYHTFTISEIIHNPFPLIKVDGEQKYEVEDILDSKNFNC